MNERSAFITDTFHRLLSEAARVWVVDSVLRKGNLPSQETRYIYARGPHGLDFGDSYGPDDGMKPMRGKRVAVTLTIEEWPT